LEAGDVRRAIVTKSQTLYAGIVGGNGTAARPWLAVYGPVNGITARLLIAPVEIKHAVALPARTAARIELSPPPDIIPGD
jgi:hypothetical protein